MPKFFVNGGAKGAGVIGGRRFKKPEVIDTDDAKLIEALRGAHTVATEDKAQVAAAERRLGMPIVVKDAIERYVAEYGPDAARQAVAEIETAETAETEPPTEETPDIEDVTREALRELCKENALPTNGNKAQLLGRLENAGVKVV